MSTFSDVPPSWLTIIEWVHQQQFDVTVNHGTAQVRFAVSATIPKRDLIYIVETHKARLVAQHEQAMAVAEKLTT